MYRRWKPSKTAAREFAQKMNEIEEFCDENGISYSLNMDSFYFNHNGKRYRVSNHTRAASNANAYDNETGEKKREQYHDLNDDIIDIFAGKTRIIEVYNNVLSGKEIDGRGNIK